MLTIDQKRKKLITPVLLALICEYLLRIDVLLGRNIQTLQEQGWAVNPEKVQGPDISVQFLGIVWRQQTKAIPEKVRNTIQQYPVATAVKQLQAFLGLWGFWRTFIPHLAH